MLAGKVGHANRSGFLGRCGPEILAGGGGSMAERGRPAVPFLAKVSGRDAASTFFPAAPALLNEADQVFPKIGA
jgi:hypothetical protein